MTVPAVKDVATTLSLLLEDGNATKFPQATVYDDAGSALSTEDLSHVAQGHYTAPYTFTILGDFFVVFVVYDDGAHTTESPRFFRSEDRVRVTEVEPKIDDIHTLVESNLDQKVSDLNTYQVRQSWTRNSPNMIGTVWLEKNGQRISLVAGDSLTLTAKVGTTAAFSGVSVAPNVDGRYNLTVAYGPTIGTLVDIDATITFSEGTFKSQVSLSVPKLSA